MADLNAYYAKIRVTEESLKGHPDGLYITSIANAAYGGNSVGGAVAEVPTKIAAKLFVDGAARKSTPDEIAAYKAQGESRRAISNAQTQRENKVSIIMIPEAR